MSKPANPDGDDVVELTELSDVEDSYESAEQALSALRKGYTELDSPQDSPQVCGQASVADGKVRAVVREAGVVEMVQFTPEALRAKPEELGRQVVEVVNAALDDLTARAGETDTTVPDLDELAEELETAQDTAVRRLSECVAALDQSLVDIEQAAARRS